eukprot:scaffold3481_cov75-Cyclotella_meneghiniana.AAC.4
MAGGVFCPTYVLVRQKSKSQKPSIYLYSLHPQQRRMMMIYDNDTVNGGASGWQHQDARRRLICQ